MAAGLFLGTGCLASYGLGEIALLESASPGTRDAISLMANVFLVIAYLLLIRRNWGVLTASAQTDRQ